MIVELNLLFCGILFHTTSVSIDRGRRRRRDRMVVGFTTICAINANHH